MAWRDGVITRAVLYDIPQLKGVDWIEPGTPITRADLEAWEKKSGVKAGPGDVILLYVGRWKRRAAKGPEPSASPRLLCRRHSDDQGTPGRLHRPRLQYRLVAAARMGRSSGHSRQSRFTRPCSTGWASASSKTSISSAPSRPPAASSATSSCSRLRRSRSKAAPARRSIPWPSSSSGAGRGGDCIRRARGLPSARRGRRMEIGRREPARRCRRAGLGDVPGAVPDLRQILENASRIPICRACLASLVALRGSDVPALRPSAGLAGRVSGAAATALPRLPARSLRFRFCAQLRRLYAGDGARHRPAEIPRGGSAGRLVCQAPRGGCAQHPEMFAADVVVPVPLHPARLRERGYNQAELIARPLARRLGLPCRSYLLVRTRSAPRQAKAHVRERWRSVRGAYAIRQGTRVDNLRVLLVDDVLTTGATLDACSRALRRRGASTCRCSDRGPGSPARRLPAGGSACRRSRTNELWRIAAESQAEDAETRSQPRARLEKRLQTSRPFIANRPSCRSRCWF